MARKHHKPEEIVAKLRQVRPKAGQTEVEVLVGQGQPVVDAVSATSLRSHLGQSG